MKKVTLLVSLLAIVFIFIATPVYSKEGEIKSEKYHWNNTLSMGPVFSNNNGINILILPLYKISESFTFEQSKVKIEYYKLKSVESGALSLSHEEMFKELVKDRQKYKILRVYKISSEKFPKINSVCFAYTEKENVLPLIEAK